MTTIRAEPDSLKPTHHIELDDGVNKLGIILTDGRGQPVKDGKPWSVNQSGMPRTALQINQGDPDYSSFELPYTPIVQRDFSGGRGNEDFERDKARYSDGYLVDTTRGDVILGPKPPPTIGSSESVLGGFTDDAQIEAMPATKWCSSFIPDVNFPLKQLVLNARANSIYVEILADNAGEPSNTVLATGSSMESYEFAALQAWHIPIAYNLVSGTRYWFRFSFGEPPGETCYGYKDISAPGLKLYTFDENGQTYTLQQNDASVSYVLKSTTASGTAHFFEYKGQLYCTRSPASGGAPTLWMNGYRGVAQPNGGSMHTLIAQMILPQGTDLVGKKIQITAGPGYEEEQNWRVITDHWDNGTYTWFQVSPEWNIAHTTATEFVILGCDTWQEITGHGLTKPVTDVLAYADLVYVAQGKDTPVRRMLEYNNGGTWYNFGHGTDTTVNEPTAKADLLALIPDTEGKFKVWRAIRSTSKASNSDAKYWGGGDLAFGTEILCGNPKTQITGLAVYGDPLLPWVLKEDSIGSVQNGIYAEVPINEMRAVRSERNGKAWLQQGVYLYFSLLDGLERYYENRLDDIGPNRDEGLPADRKGAIAHMVGYPGRIYAAIDGGDYGYSSIMCYNQVGWHEVYRSPNMEGRIRRLFIQVIPGGDSARLWFSERDEVGWLPIAMNPQTQTDYEYAPSGSLITSWFYGGYKEIKKFFRSVTLFTEGLAASGQYIQVYYRTDSEDAAWTLAGTIDTSPVQEIVLSPNMDITGRRLQLKLVLYTNDTTKTPRIKALTIDAVTRVKVKKNYNLVFCLDDITVNLQGEQIAQPAETSLALLEAWAESDLYPAPITMRSLLGMFSDKKVFVDAPRVTPIEVTVTGQQRRRKLLVNLPVYEA